jgi:hypothetical protein
MAYMSHPKEWRQQFNVFNHLYVPIILQVIFNEQVQPCTLADHMGWLLISLWTLETGGVSLNICHDRIP